MTNNLLKSQQKVPSLKKDNLNYHTVEQLNLEPYREKHNGISGAKNDNNSSLISKS